MIKVILTSLLRHALRLVKLFALLDLVFVAPPLEEMRADTRKLTWVFFKVVFAICILYAIFVALVRFALSDDFKVALIVILVGALTWVGAAGFVVVATFDGYAFVLVQLFALVDFGLCSSLVKLMGADASYFAGVFKKVKMAEGVGVALALIKDGFAFNDGLFVGLEIYSMRTVSWFRVDVFVEIILTSIRLITLALFQQFTLVHLRFIASLLKLMSTNSRFCFRVLKKIVFAFVGVLLAYFFVEILTKRNGTRIVGELVNMRTSPRN